MLASKVLSIDRFQLGGEMAIDKNSKRSTSKLNSDINDKCCSLIHHQANLAALEEETRRSKLIPADEINSEWAEMTSIMRAKITSIPEQVAAVGCGITDYNEMESLVKDLVHAALDELAITK